jgi:hypothetical protein
MSAPLVVNTRDGVCWTRRAVTSGGIALYAPESVKSCPEFVMATIDELAEQGIVGSADVLPMPVAPERPLLSVRTRELVEMEADRNRWKTEAGELRARVAELEAAAKEIVGLHTDSPMGPCPVCIDADAMVRGDDYTLPYPCPTARLAGAKDCDPPSYRTADFFQPGHAYTHRPGPDSPGGPRLRFYCESVTTDKATGQPVARGWGGRRYGDRWTSVQRAHGLEDWQSGAWADTTTGGDA